MSVPSPELGAEAAGGGNRPRPQQPMQGATEGENRVSRLPRTGGQASGTDLEPEGGL